ncbi:ribonuclease HI [Entomortierella parvispora]|uniref:Ribonuclease H n=1 Tax=Entomortierella parvispora TaxID=205924 RepID=A0A9P3LVU1_9FUNG|nr:ribonuclease HI [Entomortierella parvispora]
MPKSKAPKQGFYAVHVGKTKGIYYTWPDCEKQVSGVVGAKFKKFDTQKEAEEFVRNGPRLNYTKPSHNGSTAASGKPYAATAAGRSHHTSSVSPGTTSKAGSAVNTKATKDNIRISNGVRMTSSDTLVVYTDGSALGNGKAKSQAGVGVFFGVNDPRNISERLDSDTQTNQRAELTAAYRALEACGSDTKPIEIRTDSMYTVNIVTKWAEGWAKNNWRRSDGDPVMNRDIIEPLMEKIKKRPGPINWVHVRAHVGEFGNEMADRLANAGAVMPRPTRS